MGAYVIFNQPDDKQTREYFLEKKLPETYVDLLPRLDKGQCILYAPGQTPVRMNHTLLPSEIPLVQTVEAREQLNKFTPLSEMDEWRERTGIRPMEPLVPLSNPDLEQWEKELRPTRGRH